MPGLVPGIHVCSPKKDVDGRVKPGHDAGMRYTQRIAQPRLLDFSISIDNDPGIGIIYQFEYKN
ncbi:MAG: hypothetical protein ACTHNN_04050 [Xanthobacteraceae bacterium]